MNIHKADNGDVTMVVSCAQAEAIQKALSALLNDQASTPKDMEEAYLIELVNKMKVSLELFLYNDDGGFQFGQYVLCQCCGGRATPAWAGFRHPSRQSFIQVYAESQEYWNNARQELLNEGYDEVSLCGHCGQ